ncbi:helix-turn-helix domain-containing protein [Leptospira ognonensis]|uniref:Helix-turn-helix domain-containing protein n=1 Tax=Leptospira ognonensis TaxID=2484945 RepID=A0A4V3JQP5_9LEPT|nr:7TM diverse intracellular signaling domain-containing protein [Leptospira ognonensis]TGL56265.1 helix-turn-helix domain-containing protein [Leptospira ognonensis]
MTKILLLFILVIETYSKLDAYEKKVRPESCSEAIPLSSYLSRTPMALTLEDPTGAESAEELVTIPKKWRKVNLPYLLGFTKATHWICLNILNDTNNETFYLENTAPYVDHVEIFQFSEGELISHRIDGDKYPLRKSPFPHYPNPVFDISLPKNKKSKLLLKFSAESNLFIDPQIFSDSEMHLQIVTTYGKFYGFFGILVMIFSLNIMLFLRTRNTSFLYYSIYAFFTAIYQFTYFGLGKVYLWPESGSWNNQCIVFFGSTAFLGVILFSNRFLGIAKRTKFVYPILLFLSFLILINACTSLFLSLQTADKIVHVLGTITSFLLLGIGIYVWKKGLKIARFYILAWFALLISIVLFNLFALGVLTDSPLARYSVQIGTLIEMFLFNFAIVDRMQELNENKYFKMTQVIIGDRDKADHIPKKSTRLLNLDRSLILEKMKLLMEEEKLYCDEDLSLNRLSEMLGIRADQLSELINEEMKTNFSGYINQYRIVESKELLRTEPKRSVLSIAFAVGFNTKSSFYESFQKFTGMNPKDFRKNVLVGSSDS